MSIPPHRRKKRLVFILRLWARGHEVPEWIGEVQDVQTGETAHVQGLQALFDFLKEKTTLALESPDETKQH